MLAGLLEVGCASAMDDQRVVSCEGTTMRGPPSIADRRVLQYHHSTSRASF